MIKLIITLIVIAATQAQATIETAMDDECIPVAQIYASVAELRLKGYKANGIEISSPTVAQAIAFVYSRKSIDPIFAAYYGYGYCKAKKELQA